MGFTRGFLAPFRGGIYVVRHRLWGYLLLPLLLDLGLASGLVYLMAAHFWNTDSLLPEQLRNTPLWRSIILIVFTAVSAVVLFLALQPPLLAAFSDRLSLRIEKTVRGSAPSEPMLASAGNAILHGLLKVLLYGVGLFAGFVLSLVGPGIGFLAGAAIVGLFLAYDGFDFPLSRRGTTFGAKWAYLARHPAQTIGFATGTALLYFVPLAALVAPSFAAAGATLAFLDTEIDSGRAATVSEDGAKHGAPIDGNVAANT